MPMCIFGLDSHDEISLMCRCHVGVCVCVCVCAHAGMCVLSKQNPTVCDWVFMLRLQQSLNLRSLSPCDASLPTFLHLIPLPCRKHAAVPPDQFHSLNITASFCFLSFAQLMLLKILQLFPIHQENCV